MAEHLLRQHAKANELHLEVASAGLAAFAGDRATEHTIAALSEVGIHGIEHRSRRVHPHLLEQFDLILPMTLSHKTQLLELAPELAGKIFLLKEFAKRGTEGQEVGESVEKAHEISDPFGQSLEVYRQSRDEIDQAVQAIITHLMLGGKNTMKIAIGADHGGFVVKQTLLEHIRSLGFEIQDFGTDSEESCDYPDIAHEVSKAVAGGGFQLGILICGTGIGMSIAANKVPGIRAALCHDTYSARMARAHNDSNVLCLGARVLGTGLLLDIAETYLQGSFAGGRHSRRVDKIEQV